MSKITKIVTVNPKIEFSIDYVNTFGNKETLLIPVQGFKKSELPKSQNDDLLKKIQFYIFQGAIKEITEDVIEPAKPKSDNPFASMAAVEAKKDTQSTITKPVEKEISKNTTASQVKEDSKETQPVKSNTSTAANTAKK